MMRRGPEHAGRVEHVAVALDVHRQAPVLLVGERAAHRGRRPVADARAARVAQVLIVLLEVPEPEGPAAAVAALGDERPVLVADDGPELGGHPPGADGRGVPRVGRLVARRLTGAPVRLLEAGAALLERAAPIVGRQPLDRLGQRRERRLGVGRHRDVHFRIALEVLEVALGEQIDRIDADEPRARPDARPRAAVQRVAEGVDRAPEVGQLEAEDDVGVGDELPGALALIERMPRRNVHAPALIDDRRLKRLGQLHEPLDPGGRAREPVGDDHRVLRVHEQPRRLGHGARVALRRRGQRQLRHAEARRHLGRNRIFLEPAVDDDHHRHHRRRHRDLVGADGRLGEVRQGVRVVVPLGEVAHHRRRVLHAVRPLHAGAPHRRVERVAGEDVDRHAVAVGVVDRHRRVLQADRAVGEDRHRLPFHLEVAVGHGHRRLFMAAGDELRHRVAAVVDDRLVNAAEARAGIRRDVLEVQRLEDVDHEVAAGPGGRFAGDLDDRVGLAGGSCRRRARPLGRRSRCGRLGGRRHGIGHERRRARHRRTLQKVPTIDGQFPAHRVSSRKSWRKFTPRGPAASRQSRPGARRA